MTENKSFNSVIIGTVLGDSSLIFGDRNKNCRIDFCHCLKQKEYFFWKIKLLEEFGIYGNHSFYNGCAGNYPKFRYSSHVDTRLTELYESLYQFRKTSDKKRKCVKKKALNKLDDLGLAIWFMDDGYNNKDRNYMHLATYCFTKIDNEKIRQWLNIKYDIKNTKIYRRKDKYFLVWYEDAPKIRGIIEPYVSEIECMRYKII